MSRLSEIFLQNFPFEPTPGQIKLFDLFAEFLIDKSAFQPAFVIRGYAGTGKTTVVSSIIQSLRSLSRKVVLMAPTGRAAKVLATYAGVQAFTIHKYIYQAKDDGNGSVIFRLQNNNAENAVFFVDEASMISDDGFPSLLRDLIEFVYQKPGNKLVFIGDAAQLPPVGKIYSPALDKDLLQHNFRLQVQEAALTQVMRQQLESGILYNATRLRAWIIGKKVEPLLTLDNFNDLIILDNDGLEDVLRRAYQHNGHEQCVIITGANYRANKYNQFIRRSLFYRDDELEVGDNIMIVKNNYLFLPNDSPAGFLANGDFAEVLKIVRYVDVHDFRFADIYIRLLDYPDLQAFEVRVNLDSLHCNGPSLPDEDMRKLAQSVREDYAEIKGKGALKKALKDDICLNALQIKFSYALTCHKSQGGQWQTVILEPGFYKEGEPDLESLRWLYTGFTRATEKLYLLGFPNQFFEPGLAAKT
jgi:ATP-dependent exoDNAse (exonuclease V) alpha subunit